MSSGSRSEPPFEPSAHMTPDEFRRWGHALVDWLAEYRERVEELPVLSRAHPGEIRAALPPAAPAEGETFDRILADVDRVILPGVTHWQSPNFFAYFPANASGPSILGELLSAGLGVQGMLWATSPACTELETHLLDWLVDMMGLPAGFKSSTAGGGVIQDSASSANLCAILAARERATGGASNRLGCDRGLVAYASTETHSSVAKGIRIAGIGAESLRVVPVDRAFAMRPDELERHIDADLEAGLLPFFVCATVGTTSSQAMDPLRAIGEICRGRGLWLHIDAAMAGTAALCPELRHLQDGVELADSYCFDPHKWMFTNFDCTCMWVADRRALIEALAITPEYLRNRASESGEVIDYRDWHVPLGRRFRSLKLWFVIRHYGVDGLRRHIRRHVEWTRELRSWIEADGRFELAAPTPLDLVCFRLRAGDAATQALLDRLNRSGRLYLTSTRLDDKLTIRLCVGQTHTERRHVVAAWDRIRTAAADVHEGAAGS
ncbi:MAG TPA: pyridoxal-dependent decarboxylase [Thermoanaerobaculia bacterium]|nr:pyridoxal-dependent decarboxylase [Thermoanaerobaculia bacterium]